MSLVAYDSSDESCSEEETTESPAENPKTQTVEKLAVEKPSEKLCLPAPKHDEDVPIVSENENSSNGHVEEDFSEKIHFEKLPKPRGPEAAGVIEEEDDEVLHKTEVEVAKPEKPAKKERGPVRITVPSLSEFKDVDEENEKKNRIMPSKAGTGLFALLPAPKVAERKATKILIPQIVSKKASTSNQPQKQPANKQVKNSGQKVSIAKSSLVTSSYDSNSEDEDDSSIKAGGQSSVDFFSLSSTDKLPEIEMAELPMPDEVKPSPSVATTSSHETQHFDAEEPAEMNEGRTLVSNVINLSKEEILLKNKAEVGPKLPVPEQEYNVDREGNVAFDDKAIEYLCGKRGIKRKNKEIDEANIIEINGEDIKPDEREWLVKALTEEPVQRPVSMMGGVNSTSKKKHQITYLAHQAKAMEMELKNQWAVNRMTRKQTQSKYGF